MRKEARQKNTLMVHFLALENLVKEPKTRILTHSPNQGRGGNLTE